MKNMFLTGLCAGVMVVCSGTGTAEESATPANPAAAGKAEKPAHEKAVGPDSTAMQGSWKGRSLRDNPEHRVTFSISGKNFSFRDETETNNWYKGTFILKEAATPKQFIAKITECPFPQYVGKTSMAIYKLEHGTLTITANEPGKEAMPGDFDSAESACIELKKP